MKTGMLSLAALTAVLLATGCAREMRSPAAAPPGPVYTSTTEPGLIPAGTQLVIRTNEAITATSAAETRNYSGEVDRDVVNGNGTIVIRKGSPAQLTVMETDSGSGAKQLQLGVRSITVAGRTYNVSTPTVKQTGREGPGANRRTAEHVGGGAALGTLLGAVAGGGTGAAVGAGAGAAGGAATQVLTKGSEVRVPAETLLTFRLDEPVELHGSRDSEGGSQETGDGRQKME